MTATALPKFFTTREFLQQTELTDTTLDTWIQQRILKPISVMGNRVIFLRRHYNLVQKIKQLLDMGYTIEQVREFIQNEDINMDELRNVAPDYSSMSYQMLVEEAQRQRIRNFRRMTREQLIICLSDPERRQEIIDNVREELRRQRRGNNEAGAENIVTPNEHERELSNLQRSELVAMAQAERILYFRQMSKQQLILCLAYPERREAIVEEVRQATLSRYHNRNNAEGTTRRRRRAVVFVGQVEQTENTETNETQAPVTEQLQHVTVEENTTVNEHGEVENTQEVVQQDVAPITAVMPDGTQVVIQMTPFTAYTYEQLRQMNSKVVGNVARDAGLFPYFRRMTKNELIEALLNPNTRQQHVLTAWHRYQLYIGREYGPRRGQ